MTRDLDITAREKRETALGLLTELISADQAAAIRQIVEADNFGSALLDLTLDQCYSDIWTRPALSRKERSLVTLGVLVALKAAPEMVHQTRIAIRNGLTSRQIEEVVLQALTYVGIPAANLATATMAETLKGMGIKTENRTADDA